MHRDEKLAFLFLVQLLNRAVLNLESSNPLLFTKIFRLIHGSVHSIHGGVHDTHDDGVRNIHARGEDIHGIRALQTSFHNDIHGIHSDMDGDIHDGSHGNDILVQLLSFHNDSHDHNNHGGLSDGIRGSHGGNIQDQLQQ